MKVQVRFFASLREQFADAADEVDIPESVTVADVWSLATQGAERPASMLCAVNMEYVDLNHAVNEGDEVAFFPPVTGG